MYQLLQPLQGVYVPHLLAYGFLDGWQYFVVGGARSHLVHRIAAAHAETLQDCSCKRSFTAALACPLTLFCLLTLGAQATSLEGPPLSKEEGWAMSDADTCEAALAALDAVSGWRPGCLFYRVAYLPALVSPPVCRLQLQSCMP